MARPRRMERAGGWYHVTARGNERRAIYRDDRDRRHFCGLLARAARDFRWFLHAYVMMDNHYHLLVETPEANLARAMHWLNVSYSVRFNRRHGRVGHLFQGRYKAILVDRLGWGLELSRYVHLNPVRLGRLGLSKADQRRSRAGTAEVTPAAVRERMKTLRGHRWSSYRAYVGLGPTPAWLNCEAVLGLLGGSQGLAQRKAYREYLESTLRQGLPASPWEKLTERVVLGSAEFVRQIGSIVEGNARHEAGLFGWPNRPTLAQAIQAVERLKGEAWSQFRDRHGDGGRDLVLYLGRRDCDLRLKELGEAAGGIDPVSVSLAAKRFEIRAARDNTLVRALSHARELVRM